MAYTDIDDPTAYFQTILYSGNETARSITLDGNSDLQPDWVWIKQRSRADPHILYDSVRGTTKELSSNTTTVEHTNTAGLTSFNSDGFSIGNHVDVNRNSTTFVAWNWKAGTSFTNDASSTGIGTIDSTGSASDISGFSIVSYTGTGSAGTIKHGLNSTPSTIILKNRDDGSVFWYVFHKSLGNNSELYLNGTDAAPGSTSAWNTTSPTSSVFSIGSHGGTNASGQNIIAYCFAEKKGYSKFGKFTGNGSTDGTFIYTGFKPSFWLQKRSDGSGGWVMYDNKRAGYNPKTDILYANDSAVEDTSNAVWADIVSNGFKYRTVGGNDINNSGNEYIYMAFAESPFTTSTGIPTTAR